MRMDARPVPTRFIPYGGGLLPPPIGYQIESIPLAGMTLGKVVPKGLPLPKKLAKKLVLKSVSILCVDMVC